MSLDPKSKPKRTMALAKIKAISFRNQRVHLSFTIKRVD
jgi:hypothetical protein